MHAVSFRLAQRMLPGSRIEPLMAGNAILSESKQDLSLRHCCTNRFEAG